MKTQVLALALSACLAGAQERPVAETSVRHVTVVNVTTGAEVRDQTVRIQGNRILSITATQEADAGLAGGVDGHGGFLIPGLWDMHVHVHESNELPLYIANGVTGVRLMAGQRDTAGYRAELGRTTPAPEIYLASAIVDGSSPMWPGSIVVKNARDARRTVDEIKASGADFIKVYNGVPRDAYFALADEAKQQHISFAGHVPEAITAQEASAAGQRSMEHLQGIALGCSGEAERLMGALNRVQFFRERMVIEAEGYRTIDQGKCQALFAEFVRNDTWQVPTLTVLRLWGRLDDSKFTSDARLAYIGRKSRDRWDERTEPQRRRWSNREFNLARHLFEIDEHVVGSMFKAGVPLMAGTDAMNPYCFPGFSLHDELALMVESGLTPLAALQAATMNPARFLGRSAELGTVEAGKIANLVLLRADPIADIRNTTQIEGVWLQGRYFDEAAIAQMLEAARQAAKH
ncbi:MAG: amidohydrolase family protein [Terriglobales bacterium]